MQTDNNLKTTVSVTDEINMRKMLITVITVILSWLGWWIGYHVGLMTAFMLSMLGTGAGLYYGRKLIDF